MNQSLAISFAVKQGECFGLLGPNGAGKTTTVRMLYVLAFGVGLAVMVGDQITDRRTVDGGDDLALRPVRVPRRAPAAAAGDCADGAPDRALALIRRREQPRAGLEEGR